MKNITGESIFFGLNKRLLAMPAYLVVGHLLFGVCVASYGPLEYRGYQHFAVASYIGLVSIIFIFGFQLGSRVRLPVKAIWKKEQNQSVLMILIRGSLVISVLLMTYELFYTSLAGGLNLSMATAAQSYFDSYSGYQRNSGNYSMRFLLTSMFAFPLFIVQVLGLYYFSELDRTTRVGVIYIFAASILVYTLGGGKQKQFGDMLIYILSAVIARQGTLGKINVKAFAFIGFAIFVGAVTLLSMLAFRYKAIGLDLTLLNDKLHPLIEYRTGYWLEEMLGKEVAFPFVMFSSYLGQGYYGLSLALEQPFTWTGFAGSSYSVSVILNQFLGAEFWVKLSYPYLVGYSTGWDQTKWHTVFAWLASDLTFTGVVFFMGFMAFIYGRAWREILVCGNPVSVMMFTLMNVGFAYAPANNQLMHTPGALSTTLGVFFVYLLFHGNFNASSTTVRKLRFRVFK